MPLKNEALVVDATKGLQQSPHTDPQFGLLATAAATERSIADLRTAMDAAAAAGDVATYKTHQAEYTKALAARSPERINQLNEQHLAEVERTVAMANHGLRQVPARWLKPRHNTRVALEPAETFNGLDEAEVLRSA